MRIVQPAIEFQWITPEPLKAIERMARICYKSEARITEESAPKMVKTLIAKGHWAMLKHASMAYIFICDRGVSHELVRHGLASFAQESTRYCNYTKGQFGQEISVIQPDFEDETTASEWQELMLQAEEFYRHAIARGERPEMARSGLPTGLKTEIGVTANLLEWRHIFSQRLSEAAHPQIRELMRMVLTDAKGRVEIVFDDF